MTKRQEKLIQEQIAQKKQEIDELNDLYFDLKLKKESKGVGTPFTPHSAVKTIGEMQSDVASAIERDSDEFFKSIKNLYNAPVPFLLKQWEQHMTPKGDKPCRSMREGLYLKANLCGDMPGLAPKGKCYFDHQKDCNAWCTCWEGNEDDEEVKKIREIQDNIKNCGLPSFKVVEDGDADKNAKIKMEQLGIKTEKIVKEAIQKVILAGIELFIVGDLSDMDAIKEIEDCLEDLKKEKMK